MLDADQNDQKANLSQASDSGTDARKAAPTDQASDRRQTERTVRRSRSRRNSRAADTMSEQNTQTAESTRSILNPEPDPMPEDQAEESSAAANEADQAADQEQNTGGSSREDEKHARPVKKTRTNRSRAPRAAEEANQQEEKKEKRDFDNTNFASGILEVMPEGFGFIRSDNFLPGENDVYVSPSQIRKFRLKTGDVLTGNTRMQSQTEKYSALLYLLSVNGEEPYRAAHRYNFEDMTPIFPNERIHLERPGGSVAMRIVDLVSPIGKGQRGMIVSPPKAGKTTLLKDCAKSILVNHPEMHVMILLIDERPEEVTDIKETVQGPNVEVIYSTFDETPEHHKRVSEMVIERAKRLVESQRDVIIFIDSITRLTRAYNQVVPPSGRTLTGGLDPAALHMPKRFFGAARNMREGGSLTILATALIDTGSKMDDVVYEEFKGTGNMELILNRKLQERRIFPAIDIAKSGTRRDDLLLSREEQDAMDHIRRALSGLKADEATESILNIFVRTKTNAETVRMLRTTRII